MPNNIAYGVLIVWPVVALILYLTLPAGRATIWTLLGGYLLLPVSTGFNPVGLPPLDKASIPSLAALVLAPLMARAGEFRWPRSMTVNLLMLAHVLSPLGTTLTNGDPIVIGTITIPGIDLFSALPFAAGRVIELIPFLLGAALLGHERGHRQVLIAFAMAGLAYSLPVLLEIRLSPFLQSSIYNVVDVLNFLQQIRDGGFRSMAFLGHGLLVSTFVAMSLMAAIGLARMRVMMFGMPMWPAVIFLAVVLLLNKSLGAIVLAIMLGGLLFMLTPRRFISVAMVIATLIVIYPVVRGSGLVPYESIVSATRTISEDRAASFDYRLKNEELLLSRAEQRPLFGWGGYGRARVISITESGGTRDVVATDGTWVIVVGQYGWIGYITCFGLLTYPIWRAFRQRIRGLPLATAALAAMHLLNLLDLIPNSSLRPITWLAAGALAGLTLASRRVTQGQPGRMPGRPGLPVGATARQI